MGRTEGQGGAGRGQELGGAKSRAIKRQELEREENLGAMEWGGNWQQQRLRQLRRYTVRKIEGLGTWGIDREGADAL